MDRRSFISLLAGSVAASAECRMPSLPVSAIDDDSAVRYLDREEEAHLTYFWTSHHWHEGEQVEDRWSSDHGRIEEIHPMISPGWAIVRFPEGRRTHLPLTDLRPRWNWVRHDWQRGEQVESRSVGHFGAIEELRHDGALVRHSGYSNQFYRWREIRPRWAAHSLGTYCDPAWKKSALALPKK
jgi:hypothetical protein